MDEQKQRDLNDMINKFKKNSDRSRESKDRSHFGKKDFLKAERRKKRQSRGKW